MDWLAIVGDAVWILALSLIAGASKSAWARIEPDASVPMPSGSRILWRAPKLVALLFTPVLATLIGLALGAAARMPSESAAPLIVFGARMALAPPLVLLHLMHLHRAMGVLADEGQLRP
jgi:purine-cytosine permease-like protein